MIFFCSKPPPADGPFFEKIKFTLLYRTFFFQKMKKWLSEAPPEIRHIWLFFKKIWNVDFKYEKFDFFGIFYTFLDKFFGLYYSGENFLADIIGANENQKKHWYYRREWTVAFLADFRWRFFFLTGSFFITTLTTWLKNLTQQKEK